MYSASHTGGLAGQRRAVTGGEQKPLADARPALRKPIGVAREERVAQRLVRDVRRNLAAEHVARNSLKLRT